jgi:glycine/D-amino acid oxidase-like deaminating enzyme
MLGSAAPRIVIVGSGIIGASIAYHLTLAGVRPIVLAGRDLGGLATPASFAWINASAGNPEPYFRLRMRAIAGWHDFCRALPELPISWCGSLTYDLPDAELEDYVARHAGWGYRIRMVGPDEIRRREPCLRQVPARAALCEDEGMIEPQRAAMLLIEAAVKRGASCVYGPRALRLVTQRGRVLGVETDARGGLSPTIEADAVIVAAGIASPALLAEVGYTLPIDAPDGLLAHTEPLPPALNGLVIAPAMHVRQTREGRLVAGVDFAGSVSQNADATAHRLIETMAAAFALPMAPKLSHVTLGLRPTPKDGFPVVGAVPGTQGLYVAVMHSGITLAPAVGAFLAAEVLEGVREPLLEPYRPERFA